MRKIFYFLASTALCLLLVGPAANAGAPYDITLITFDDPTTGGAPDGYNLYIDDCAATGSTGPAFASVNSGDSFTSAFPVDGSYEVCVRAFNATGEQPDPGPVATVTVADLPLPGVIENLSITVDCPSGGCSVSVVVN